MAADAPDGANGGARKRGPFYVVIAAVFVPFLALLFPYLLLDDYRRTRSLADAGARGVTDPKRRGRERDGMFIGAGVVWVGTLLGMLAGPMGLAAGPSLTGGLGPAQQGAVHAAAFVGMEVWTLSSPILLHRRLGSWPARGGEDLQRLEHHIEHIESN